MSRAPMQQEPNAHSSTTEISAVCADGTAQRIRGKCTSIDISSRTNWVGKAEARISNARAETAVMQGKQIPSFKAVWGKKSFALQSLHVIRTEAEYLCFIRVK